MSSAVIELFRLIHKNHRNDAWVHINPMYAKTLRLALSARMEFGEDDMTEIARTYSAGHWRGEGEWEDWYALAIGAHKTAAPSFEKMMGRRPFILDGERVYVGRRFAWQDSFWTCTSIEADFVRAKRDVYQQPATLIEIPREGFEAKVAEDKAMAKAERAANRAALRADPVDLRPLWQHFDVECRSIPGRWGGGTHVDQALIEWAAPYGSDYRLAWTRCNRAWWLATWLVWLGVCKSSPRANDADAIRKQYSWAKVEQAIFRFVRTRRGLPLRDATGEAYKTPAVEIRDGKVVERE